MHRSASHGPLVPTLAAQTGPPRSKRKAAAAAHVLIGLRPLTCAELASRVDTKDPPGLCERVKGERRAFEAMACTRCFRRKMPDKGPPGVTNGLTEARVARRCIAVPRIAAAGSPDTLPHVQEESSVSTLEASSAQESGRRPDR